MPKWKETPFETLEDAHRVATRLELNPSSIIDTGKGFRSFETKVGRQRSIIAQKVEGGPVLEKRLPKGKKSGLPLQDPSAPKFGEEDRLLTGPWTDSDHATLDAVRAHYQQLGPSTKHSIAFVGELMVVEYPNKDVVEYRKTDLGLAGVQRRSLFSAKGRYLKPYNKAEFLVGPWSPCDYASSLEVVKDHWKEQYVNFDNVEILKVTLYRIGQDEYEYTEDVNTGEVWTRVLSRVRRKQNA
jgi:hypothetical protein